MICGRVRPNLPAGCSHSWAWSLGDVGKLLPAEPVNVVTANKPVPPEFEREMAKTYLPLVEQLCERFDGAPRAWRARYEKVIQRHD